MESQHSQSQFTPVGRVEDQTYYYNQYPPSVDAHYQDIQDQSLPAPSYQHFPVSGAPPHRPSESHLQETASVYSEPSSYGPEAHLPYNVRDGTLDRDSSAVFHHQGNIITSSSVNQQEVPSSYSSVTGKQDNTDENEQSYKLLPLPNSLAQDGQHHPQPPLPAAFTYGKQLADSMTNLADQPLEFAPGFNRNNGSQIQSGYAHHDSVGPVRAIDPVAAVHSINNWTPPVAPGLVYPSISSDISSGLQHDPSMAIHSPVPGHAAPPFGRFPGPGQAAIPSGGAPFALGAGTALHPTAAFAGDVYGISPASERPRKASVPNWLKDEIKKAVITSSSVDHPKEETHSIEDEGSDRSFVKADQADSKSIDSSRSTEEEDEDEDYVEAARTAAINQEIKRVLTEVLLKVTDELFDEIATKVLSEDDPTVEADQKAIISNHKELPSSNPAVQPHKASAKVLIPAMAKDSDSKSDSEKSSSSSPGDILGLGNYASDNDNEVDEIQSSSVQNSSQQSSIKKLSEDTQDAAANGISEAELRGNSRHLKRVEKGLSETSSVEPKNTNGATIHELCENGVDRDLGRAYSSKLVSKNSDDGIAASEKMLDGSSASRSKNSKAVMESELPEQYINVKKTSSINTLHSETNMKLDENEQQESKSSSGKDFVRDRESSKIRADDNGDEKRRRRNERHPRKEKGDDRNGSKERTKEKSFEPLGREKLSESRKRSDRLDVKEDRKETERFHRASAKGDTSRKREKDDEEDISRHKIVSESNRHKKRRSSSISSKGRSSKDTSVNHANDSSDEATDDSKRKLRSRKRNSSPSPVRSRRRQVSRSPHSKHSQRRHSPYSSLETTRGRRSRSRSPVRRHR